MIFVISQLVIVFLHNIHLIEILQIKLTIFILIKFDKIFFKQVLFIIIITL